MTAYFWRACVTGFVISVLCLPNAAHCEPSSNMLLGVNRPGLLNLSDAGRQKTLELMAASGVRAIRTGLFTEARHVGEFVLAANRKGIKVIFVIRTWAADFYDQELHARAGNSHFHSVLPLSKLRMDLFGPAWSKHRDELRQVGAAVYAYQLGNEINSPGFNGDLPIEQHGGLLSIESCSQGQACQKIVDGFRKLVALAEFIHGSGTLDGSELIAGSVVAPSREWAKKTGGVFIAAPDAIRTLREAGIERFVSAYAVHAYITPAASDVSPNAGNTSAVGRLVQALAHCYSRSSLPCWLTEWGVFRIAPNCGPDMVWSRAIKWARAVIDGHSHSGRVISAFYYDWDTDVNLSLVRCGILSAHHAYSFDFQPIEYRQ